MLAKAIVEARLAAVGAFWLFDVDDLHCVYGTAWGFEIWVPIAGPGRGMYEDDLVEIEAEIRASRP